MFNTKDINFFQPKTTESIALLIFILLLSVVLIRTAWICDDAYISFRTVYNLAHGYGLTWNTTERVQVYTNPLWIFLIFPAYLLLGDIWITSHLVSILTSLAAIYILLFKISKSLATSIIAATILLFSNAFIDCSTSGLENPLTHLLLAIFFYIFYHQEQHKRQILLLSLVTSLLMVNRLDTILLVGPCLGWVFFKRVNLQAAIMLALGMLPFVTWEIFSLIYYGFLFPNTYYAKLNLGIWQVPILIEGIRYLLDSIGNGPITLFTIFMALVLGWWQKAWKLAGLLLGVALYLVYIVKIGGDFMGGRFLSAPLFCSVIALTQLDFSQLHHSLTYWIILGTLLMLGLSSPFPPIFSNSAYGKFPPHLELLAGYNTRSHYYQQTGLLRLQRDWTRGKPHPAFIHKDYQPLVRACNGEKTPIVHGGMGLLGFDAGPRCYIVDAHALTDPYLSKLPAIQDDWRPGHYRRKLPRGYIASLRQNSNKIQDPNLARLYDQIQTVTRGELFTRKRWQAIWDLNLGKYQKLVAQSEEFSYPETRIYLHELAETKPEGTFYFDANENFTTDRLVIVLDRVYHGYTLDLSIDHKQDYRMLIYNRDQKVGEIIIRASPEPLGGLKRHLIDLPQEASEAGFNRIVLEAIHDWQDSNQKWVRFYSIGHLYIL